MKTIRFHTELANFQTDGPRKYSEDTRAVVVEKFLRKGPQVSPNTLALHGQLRTAARYQRIDHVRKRQREARALSELAIQQETAGLPVDSESLLGTAPDFGKLRAEALQVLTETDRMMIVRHEQGIPHAKIAEELGKNHDAVRQGYRRAIGRLVDEMVTQLSQSGNGNVPRELLEEFAKGKHQGQ